MFIGEENIEDSCCGGHGLEIRLATYVAIIVYTSRALAMYSKEKNKFLAK